MEKGKFYLSVYCEVNYGEEEEVGKIEVDSLYRIMEIVNVLAKWGKPAYAKDNGIAEEYRELLESVETSCGGEVTLIGEVEGLHFLYKDEKGVTVEAELDYDCGVRANAKVNGEEYKNSSSKALKEAKNLAVQILKLG